MATSNSSRQERRRRIVERGSDRLALITGVRSLTSSPLSSPHFRASQRTFTSVDYPSPQSILSDRSNAGAEGSSGPSASTLLQNEAIVNALTAKTSEIGKQVEPEQNIHDARKETRQAPSEDTKTISEPSPVTSKVEKPSNETEPLPKPSKIQLNLFSCKQVSSCIIASQKTRSFCSLMIALLVVLSSIDDPLNIVSSEGIAASGPVYLLLVTDATILLVKLCLEEQKHSGDAEKESVEAQEAGDHFTQALTVMERGLLVYQTIRAFFIDFSIYTVVIVCGLSLL